MYPSRTKNENNIGSIQQMELENKSYRIIQTALMMFIVKNGTQHMRKTHLKTINIDIQDNNSEIKFLMPCV